MSDEELAHTFTGAALYCKAYHLRDLRAFSGWKEVRENWKPARLVTGGEDDPGNHAEDKPLSDDEVVFLHDDLTVTAGSVRGENVLFGDATAAWRRFCIEELKFRIPDDLLYRLTADRERQQKG